MDQQALDTAVLLCKKFEGLRLRPYLCPAGVPTIGYGSTYYKDGRKVTLQDAQISQEAAEELLKFTLQTVYFPGVLKRCPNLQGPLLGAMADFAYNLGVARFSTSTLSKRLSTEDWESAKKELNKWTIGGGKVLKGLVLRRAAEALYFPEPKA